MSIKVLHDFICVEEPIQTLSKSSGIVLLADKDATFRCLVHAIGPGTVDDAGKPLTTMGIKVGDIVHLPKEVTNSAPSTKIDGKTYLFIKPPQVLTWETE